MNWDVNELVEFFGCEPSPSSPDCDLEVYWFRYVGKVLTYDVSVDLTNGQVAVSGDTALPFGATSMYEIYVPCDMIWIEPGHYEGIGPVMICARGAEKHVSAYTLTVRRRLDGELTVWPYYRWDTDAE